MRNQDRKYLSGKESTMIKGRRMYDLYQQVKGSLLLSAFVVLKEIGFVSGIIWLKGWC